MHQISNLFFINTPHSKTYQEIQYAIKNKTRVKRRFVVELPMIQRGTENSGVVEENIMPVSELIKRFETKVKEEDKRVYMHSVYKLIDSSACFHEFYS